MKIACSGKVQSFLLTVVDSFIHSEPLNSLSEMNKNKCGRTRPKTLPSELALSWWIQKSKQAMKDGDGSIGRM